MDSNAILQAYIDSFRSYSASDSRPTVTKVLKYSGTPRDISRRGDIVKESVFFKMTSASVPYYVEDEKPYEIQQSFQALVFLDQPDSHSYKESAYDRIMEITDVLVDWATDTSAEAVSSQIWTLKLYSISAIIENQGYLSTTVTFQSIIKLQ